MEYYPRKIEEKMDKWLRRKEVVLLRGPRQSGKTTLFQHLKERLGGTYVTLEDENNLRAFEENPQAFGVRFGGKGVLFIDEAQYSKGVGKAVKLITDLTDLKLFVTGSGSFDVKVEVGKHLVGRAVYFDLRPLDFEEFVQWRAPELSGTFQTYKKAVSDFVLKGKKILVKPVFEREFDALLKEYVVFGGFPGVVKERDEETKKELLANLARTYVEKDVFFFLGVRHMDAFRRLLTYLSLNAGSLLEVSSVMRELHMDYKTAEHYLSILAATSITDMVSPFHKSLTTELKKARKVYFTDTGLRNALMSNFLPPENRTDKGALLEHVVFRELTSHFGNDVRYWRTTGRAEVDFIVRVGEEVVPVEVKSRTKVKRGFLSFLTTYAPSRALVVTERECRTEQIGKTTVSFIPHYFL